MKCPVCDDIRMREVVKDGVTIDVCPDCKGVWLDRGELDKLMQGVNAMRQEWDDRENMLTPPGAAPGTVPAPPLQRQSAAPTPPPIPPAQPAPGHGQQHGQQPAYGTPQQPMYGSQPADQGRYYGSNPSNGGYGHNGGYGYDKYGTKHGYDKYGRPYKKKKTVLDVFGDLFE